MRQISHSHSLQLRSNKVLPHCLPLIERRLQNDAYWEVQESGVLALGAVSKGCLKDLEQDTPAVLELLVRLSASNKPLLRSISCWCLTRFAPWYSQQDGGGLDDFGNPSSPSSAGSAPGHTSVKREVFLQQILKALLLRMLDRNKCVQEAACSAVAVVEENARYALIPYLPLMCDCFNKALLTYQTRNLSYLYDVIGTLAKMLQNRLVEECPKEYLKAMIDPLVGRFEKLHPGKYELIPFTECITQVIQSIGAGRWI